MLSTKSGLSIPKVIDGEEEKMRRQQDEKKGGEQDSLVDAREIKHKETFEISAQSLPGIRGKRNKIDSDGCVRPAGVL